MGGYGFRAGDPTSPSILQVRFKKIIFDTSNQQVERSTRAFPPAIHTTCPSSDLRSPRDHRGQAFGTLGDMRISSNNGESVLTAGRLCESHSVSGFFTLPMPIHTAHHDLGDVGKWFFMTPGFSERPNVFCLSVWQCARPFENAIFSNHSTSLIIKHIEKDLGYWLNPSGMELAEISECFSQVLQLFLSHAGNANSPRYYLPSCTPNLSSFHVRQLHRSTKSN